MAQGLDSKSWNSDKSPSMDSKGAETVRRTRGVGSRRIFPPQFKLQVLDSYRNDVDCRGNQRATARKYNIHRRQIQKWLQCEQNLRTCVEESAKNEIMESKQRKKTGSEEDKTVLTLNQSATAFTRLGDAGGRLREPNPIRPIPKQENKVYEESKLEAQNLKRVAQKLYPSLQGIPCVQGEKVAEASIHVDGQKYFGGDVVGVGPLALSPGPADKRDDNFNRLVRTDDDGPLDLKSKVRSEMLPEEFLASNGEDSLPDENTNKLTMGGDEKCESELTSSNENIGGQKLSVSNAVLKCVVQKYTEDVDGREFYTGDSERKELLCSRGVSQAESSCLLDVQAPRNSGSVPYLPGSSVRRDGDEGEETGADLASDLNLSTDGYGPDTCRKKGKSEGGVPSKVFRSFDWSKSFSPKRKWMKESMQEMSEDCENSQETSSLPIKQRVKMNLRSLPEATYTSEDCSRPNGVSSNFTIERLCSTDMARENETLECYGWRSPCNFSVSETSLNFPPPLVLPNRIIPDLVSLHFKPEMYTREKSLEFSSLSPNEDPINVTLKEEKVSDSEDMDIDILSTTPVEKKSFDFSNYNFGKRRSFSVQFKLTVLDAFYNDKDCNKNQRATARKFNINRRQVQKWLSQESDLRSEGSVKNGKYIQRQRLGGEIRDGDGCTRCPHHCLQKKEEPETFAKTIEVNVKHCSDNECLSRRNDFNPDSSRARLADGVDFYSKNLFQSDLKTSNFYHNYLFPENNNMIYHDSILGWPNLNGSALSVPNFQYLSTWHHNFDFCQENQKIY